MTEAHKEAKKKILYQNKAKDKAISNLFKK